MRWPLALSAGLMERSTRALMAALWPLTVGHLLAMLVMILPFSLLVAFVQAFAPPVLILRFARDSLLEKAVSSTEAGRKGCRSG
jgi:hypothetical protein